MKRRLAVLACGLAVSSYGGQAQESAPRPQISVDILSDTGGADLNPYLHHFVSDLKQQWLPLVAGAGQQPGVRKEVVLRVVIRADGQIGSMRLEAPLRGDDGLRKAAWGAVTKVAVEPPPAPVAGHDLGLRLHFVTD